MWKTFYVGEWIVTTIICVPTIYASVSNVNISFISHPVAMAMRVVRGMVVKRVNASQALNSSVTMAFHARAINATHCWNVCMKTSRMGLFVTMASHAMDSIHV